jgi:hypothetical protein
VLTVTVLNNSELETPSAVRKMFEVENIPRSSARILTLVVADQSTFAETDEATNPRPLAACTMTEAGSE